MTAQEKALESMKKATLNQTATGKKETIYDLIKRQQKGFELVLPKGWDASRFTRLAISAIKNSQKLAQCEPMSILSGLMLSAQLGLEPNSPLHEASLIPYKVKGKLMAQFVIEYRGLLKLAWNSSMVKNIDFDYIAEGEEVIYKKGFDADFQHFPNWKGKRGKPIAYYATAELVNGGKVVVVMSKEQVIEHAKKFSPSYRNPESAWHTDFDAMAIKTCLRVLTDKKLPKSTEFRMLSMALDKDEKIIEGADKEIDPNDIDIPEAEVVSDEPTQKPEPTPEPTPESKHDPDPAATKASANSGKPANLFE